MITELKKQLDTSYQMYNFLNSIPENKLSNEQLAEKKALKEDVECLSAKYALQDPWFFIFNFVKTKDEHDPKEPVKLLIGPQELPMDYAYLKAVVDIWQRHLLLAIVKGRQIRLTWIFCALYIWDCISKLARNNGQQTKDEKAVNELLTRDEVILNNLPPRLKPKWKRTFDPPLIYIEDTDSKIMGFPQGGNAGKSYTFNNYLIDEAGIQDDLLKTYYAALPATENLAMISTLPQESTRSSVQFANIAHDDVEDEGDIALDHLRHQKMEGYPIDVYKNLNGFMHLGIFHWHIPHRWMITKDKETGKVERAWVTNKIWAESEEKKYLGNKQAWRREQEGDCRIAAGEQIFEEAIMQKVEKDIQSPLAIGKLILNEKGGIEFIADLTGPFTIYEFPQKDGQYAAGADVAAGLSKGDFSTCIVGNKETRKTVAVWKGKRRPVLFAHELYLICRWYNDAFVVPERNTYGISTIDELKDGNPLKRIPAYDNIYLSKVDSNDMFEKDTKRYGFYTGAHSKWPLIEQFAQGLRDGSVIITSSIIANEMQYYIRLEGGTEMGPAKGHDDCVIGTALMYHGFKDSPYIPPEEVSVHCKSVWDDEEVVENKYCSVTGY